jgi:Single-strand binding protein family
MTEASVSFAGNLTDDPEVRHTEGGIARAMFRVAVSGRRSRRSSRWSCGATRPSMPASRWPRAAGWWSWVGSSSAPGPVRTAALAWWSRS